MKKLFTVLLIISVSLSTFSQSESIIYPNMLIVKKGGNHLIELPHKVDLYGDNEIYKIDIIQKSGEYIELRLISKMYLDATEKGEEFIVGKYFDSVEYVLVEFYQDFGEIIIRGKNTILYFRNEEIIKKIKMYSY